MAKKKKVVRKLGKVPTVKSELPQTMMLNSTKDIAFDFSTKVYKKFERIVKAIACFGSSASEENTSTSDIDILILIDDVSIKWEEELITNYREELGKIIQENPYTRVIHVNTIKLSLWFEDAIRGDPVVINILRSGYPLIDHGGFFLTFKKLLDSGKIKPTPESISMLLERSPQHLLRARASMLSTLDGLYWACVDSAHAALISARTVPPSPGDIAKYLDNLFVKEGLISSKDSAFYQEIYLVAKEIVHGKRKEISGKKLDEYFDKTNAFIRKMAEVVEYYTK